MLLRNKQKLQFSILVFCNGRWTTHTNLTDKDLAIKRAREMAKTDRSAEAIRVMQYQNNIRGGRIETELLHIDRPEAHQSQAYQVGFVEAGLLALRERRMKVIQDDFTKAKEKALYRKKGNIPEGLYL
mgnify:CR=1 FL=1